MNQSKTTKESDKARLDKLFSFWESDLRYRIREEEKKYNNIVSIECGVDWVKMVIQKSLKDIIKESKSEIDRAYQQGREEILTLAEGLQDPQSNRSYREEIERFDKMLKQLEEA